MSLHYSHSTNCGRRKRNKSNHPDIGCSSNCNQDDVDSIMTNQNNKSIKNCTSTTKNPINKVSNATSNVSNNRIDSNISIDSNKNKYLPIEEVIPDILLNNPDDCSIEPDIKSNNQHDGFVPQINDINNFFDDDWMNLVPDMSLLDQKFKFSEK